MFNLKEYRYNKKKRWLTDELPWCMLYDDNGLMINKDGSFQKSYRFRGLDLDSATREELISAAMKINNIFKRLGSGWVIFADAIRFKDKRFKKSNYPDAICQMIENEREELFAKGTNYQSEYYLTLQYLPPSDAEEKIIDLFFSKGNVQQFVENESTRAENHIKYFVTECERVYNLLLSGFALIEPLNSEETLTYLHSRISTKRHVVKVPEIPMYLDAYISDMPLLSGFEPMLGKHHLRIISIKGFPGSGLPGILDRLNRLDIDYTWTTRFICQDKKDAIDEIKTYQRKWFAKRKSLFALFAEIFNKQESAIQDTDALKKSYDAEAAAEAIASDAVSGGYFTMTIALLDTNLQSIEKKVRAVEKSINGLGFITVLETQNACESWFGSIPGLPRPNVRRPLLTSINLVHLFPLSAVWSGNEWNKHLKAPPLMQTITTGNTPFRLNLHVGDVGHTLIVGPTGAGKSVLLATIAAQFRKYNDAQVYFFDKGGSSRVLTYGIGGEFYDLATESEGTLSFQPLANIDSPNERSWANGWIAEYFENENIEITPEIKGKIRVALDSLATSPKEQRTITDFSLLLQDVKLRQAIEPLTIGNSFGNLMDSNVDKLKYANWQVFEMNELMNLKQIVPSTLTYLFHSLEQRFTGKPTLLILDECWLLLDHPVFAEKIRSWLKELRKKNTSVVFATQSLTDIANSKIASAILDNCFTRIFLPNANAREDRMAELYYSFGLNKKEVEIISEATRKKHYYYKAVGLAGRGLGSRIFELALGKIALAYVAASEISDQIKAKEILESGKNFNKEWLKFKGLEQYIDDYTAINDFLTG